jgi:hypothetical protein
MAHQNFDLPLYDIPFDPVNSAMFLSNAKDSKFAYDSGEMTSLAHKIIQAFIDSRPKPLSSRNQDTVEDAHRYLMGEGATRRYYDTARSSMDRVQTVVILGAEALRTSAQEDPHESINQAEAEPQAIQDLDDTIMELRKQGVIDDELTKSLIILFKTRPVSIGYDVAVEQLISPHIQALYQRLQEAHMHQAIPRTRSKVNLPIYKDLAVDEGMTMLYSLKEIMKVPKRSARHPLETYFDIHIKKEFSIPRKSVERARLLGQINHAMRTAFLS